MIRGKSFLMTLGVPNYTVRSILPLATHMSSAPQINQTVQRGPAASQTVNSNGANMTNGLHHNQSAANLSPTQEQERAITAAVTHKPSTLQILSKALHSLILTPRGMLLLALALILLLGPGRLETDIIASTLGWALMLVLALSVALTLTAGLLVKRSIRIRIREQSDALRATAGSATQATIELTPTSVLPFFRLSIALVFEHPLPVSTTHHLTGKNPGGSTTHRKISEQIKFPHRGLWRTTHVAAAYGDRFGFASLKWEIAIGPTDSQEADLEFGHSFLIYPAPYPTQRLPIIASAHRPGDLMAETREPQGDLYELKKYYPGDSMRRIVWKIFAKSGDLISRHPEASVSPDGQVAIYVVALPEDDATCAVAAEFTNQIEESDLSAILGCLGASANDLALRPHDSELLLIKNTWNSLAANINDELYSESFTEYLRKVREILSTTALERVMIFTSLSGLSSPVAAQRIVSLGSLAVAQGVQPVFYVTGVSALTFASDYPGDDLLSKRLGATLSTWLTEGSDSKISSRLERTKQLYLSFLESCTAQGWQVFKVP